MNAGRADLQRRNGNESVYINDAVGHIGQPLLPHGQTERRPIERRL